MNHSVSSSLIAFGLKENECSIAGNHLFGLLRKNESLNESNYLNHISHRHYNELRDGITEQVKKINILSISKLKLYENCLFKLMKEPGKEEKEEKTRHSQVAKIVDSALVLEDSSFS
jgi:hypothetical protein